MTWTKEDEAALTELQTRKANHEQTMRECVKRAVERWACQNMSGSEITSELIDNATQIRKVLEPFDEEFKG